METVFVLIVGFICGFILGMAFMRSAAKYENKNKKKEKCPICKHETFINEYGDIQCSNCRKILPMDIENEGYYK